MVLKWKRLPHPGIIASIDELLKKHNPAGFVNRVILNPAMTTNVSADIRVIRPLPLLFVQPIMEEYSESEVRAIIPRFERFW